MKIGLVRDNLGRFTMGSAFWSGKHRDAETRHKIAETLRHKAISGQTRLIGDKRIWSDAELQVLRTLYPRREFANIERLTKRTLSAIHGKAWHEGIHCNSLKPVSVNNFSEFDLGYLAAMVEGEGSICFNHNGRNLRNGQWKVTPCVYVVCNTDEGIINHVMAILEATNFKAYKVRDIRNKGNRKMSYSISIVGQTYVHPFLQRIVPYIKGKKKRIGELVIKWCEHRANYKRTENNQRPYTEEDIHIYNEVRELNRKGKR